MKKIWCVTILIFLVVLSLGMYAFAAGDTGNLGVAEAKTAGQTPEEIIMAAFGCKNFSDEELTEEEISHILEAGVNAPSAMNGQPWRFVLVENDEQKQSLIKSSAATCIIIAVPIDGMSAQFSAGTAAESMYLYAQACGLAANMYSAPCSKTINASDEAKATFGIPSDYEAAIVIGIGNYADEVDAYASASARNPLESFVTVVE